MKKAIVLLLALVVVGAFVFAQDAPAKPYTLTANATGGWVYDITESNSYFTNSYDLSFKYALIDNLSETKGGEGTYGQIDVTHINVRIVEEVEGATNGDGTIAWTDKSPDDGIGVSAKIVSGALTVGLYGAPSASYNNAPMVPVFSGDTADGFKPGISPAAGIYVSYSLGDLGSVKASVGSKDKAVNDSYYLGGVDISLKPVKDVLSVDVGAWYDTDPKILVATGKLGVTAGDLSIGAGVDAKKVDTADLDFDVAASVAYKLFEAKDSLNLNVYYAKDTALANHQGDVGFKFVDAGGLVAPVAFTVGVFATNVMGDPAPDPMALSFAASGSYKAALSDATYVKPYGEFKMDMNPDSLSYMKFGVEAVLITNVTFDANYTAGATADDDNMKLVGADKPAKISITAKVTL